MGLILLSGLSSITSDGGVPAEWNRVVQLDDSARLEWAPTVARDTASVSEWLGGLRRDTFAPIEWTSPVSGVVADENGPFEWRQTVRLDERTLAENFGSLTHDGLVPFDQTLGAAFDSPALVDWSSGLVADEYAPGEHTSANLVQLNEQVPFETTGWLQRDSAAGIEWGNAPIITPAVSTRWMRWPDLQNALMAYLQEIGDFDFASMLPVIIGNAEFRIYRELDFLSTRGANRSLSFAAGSRMLSLLPQTGQTVGGFATLFGYPVVVEGLAALITKGAQPVMDDSGNVMTDDFGNPLYSSTGIVRTRFQRCSLDFIDFCWPDETQTAAPGSVGSPAPCYTLLDNTTIIVAPTPDQSYQAEVIGTWRPAPMSPSNPETWLGDNLPDLLFAACMVEASNYQQRDPGTGLPMSQVWEGRYTALRDGAIAEERRRKALIQHPPAPPIMPPQQPPPPMPPPQAG